MLFSPLSLSSNTARSTGHASTSLSTIHRSASCRATATYAHAASKPIDSFYGILGVDPTASVREIRSAYINLMRDFHPDQYASGRGADAAAANEFCTVLNEIYETLSDAEQRSTYDALVGFAAGGINPFLDNSLERDQVFVDELSCIGCAMCVRACPKNFQLEPSKYARARVTRQATTADEHANVAVAIETCPVDCISYVTLPQLNLLEAALATMARVDVFIMRRGAGRSWPSVFENAMREWQRRQAAINAVVCKPEPTRHWWQGASQHVEDLDGGGGSQRRGAHTQQQQGRANVDGRKVAKLAAVAARAARMWRSTGGTSSGRRRQAVKALPACAEGGDS